MIFKNIVSISTVNITKSELLKYDLKKFFIKSNFEIWDLSDFFYKNKKRYLNKNDKLKISYLKKLNDYKDIIKKIKSLDKGDLLIDPFNISNNTIFSNLIKKKNLKILQYQLGPIPVNQKNSNIFFLFRKFIESPKYYIEKLFKTNFSYKYPDYLLIVNKKNILDSGFRISKNTKIILSHSFDYNRILNNDNHKIKLSKKPIAVFLDEGVTGHPDYDYLNIKPYCNSKIYYQELLKFFDFFENKHQIEIVIAGHPKVNYIKNSNLFKRKIFLYKTLDLVKSSKIVFSHMSTSINYAVIKKKPIIFLNSDNYNFYFKNQINLHSNILKSNVINLSKNYLDTKTSFKINKRAYNYYIKRYITFNPNDKRSSWKIFYDSVD